MIAIKAEKLLVTKDKSPVLHNLSFNIVAGTIAGLIGPSGSGKTTLMRSIVGSQIITAGSLTVAGKPSGDASLRHVIGYVTQAAAVYDDLTVRQNLAYFGVLARSDNNDVDKVLRAVELTHQKDQLVRTLSGGQRARVSLAIALLGNHDVLILDEPTVGLDPVLRKKLWRLFRELADSGKTLLISSHVMDEADHCDHVLLLREGRLLWSDTRQSLLAHTNTTNVEAAFLAMVERR